MSSRTGQFNASTNPPTLILRENVLYYCTCFKSFFSLLIHHHLFIFSRYECVLHNQLGSETQSMFLTVGTGGRAGAGSEGGGGAVAVSNGGGHLTVRGGGGGEVRGKIFAKLFLVWLLHLETIVSSKKNFHLLFWKRISQRSSYVYRKFTLCTYV